MRKITYKFSETGVIPGIPREVLGNGYIGLEVDIDDDTGEILEIRHPKAPVVETKNTIIDEIEPVDNHENQ